MYFYSSYIEDTYLLLCESAVANLAVASIVIDYDVVYFR